MISYIGNDIVDLTFDNALSKYKDYKFIERVFSCNEKEILKESDRPDLLLWFLWTAKESAYKAIKKLIPNTIFSHRKFEVIFDEICNIGLNSKLSGTVNYNGVICKIDWSYSSSWIHCNAVIINNHQCSNTEVTDYKVINMSDVLDLSYDFTDEEGLSIYSDQSKAVRILAKALLYQNGLEKVRIIRKRERNRFSPPYIYVDDEKLTGWDVSMTHDGDLVACSLMKLVDK